MAQPNSLPAVAQAIELSEMVGRAMTDIEVAALAVGQLTASDLVVPMEDVDGTEAEAAVTAAGGEPNDKVEEEEEREIESDEVSSIGQEENVALSNAPFGAEGAGEDDNGIGGLWDEGKMDWLSDVWGQQAPQEPQEESLSDSDKPERPRKNKHPYFPLTGPLSYCPEGDVTDGEDGELAADGVPMTKNEEIEPILPLGEVSVDEGKVMPVGTILSLVEPDGTIVIRGTPGRPPLAEGSVLFAETQDIGSKEPLGRIHEIFGPCSVPHYTIRVEGAATQHQIICRYQTAIHKLLKAEKARADAFKASVIRQEDAPAVAAENGEAQEGAPAVAAENGEAQEDAPAVAAENGEAQEDAPAVAAENGEAQEGAPAVAAENGEAQEGAPAVAAENGEAQEGAPAATAENGDIAQAAGQEPAPPRPMTPAEYREMMQNAAYERHKPNPNAMQKMAALRRTVEEAEEAMGDQKLHPFRRWKVDTAVYALEKHAKYLAKELLVSCGKGTDASNLNDEEESAEEYFSDDEKERLATIQKRKNKRRQHLAEQGLLSDEIDVIFKEEEERKNRPQKKDVKPVATEGKEARKRVRGRQNGGAEARARGDQGRGGRGTGNLDGTGTHGLEQGGPHSGIGRGGGLRGGGDRAHFGGRLGPRGFPAAGPPGQPGHGMGAPGSMGTPGGMPYGVPGFPAWGPPRNGFRGGPPCNVGAMMSGTLGPTPQQHPRGPPPGHCHFPSQQYPPPRPVHHIGAANGFAYGRGPPLGRGMAMMRGTRFQPRSVRPPPPLPSPHFPPRQQIPNPSQFIQHQQQPRHQARPLRVQQPFVGYGAQPVNPVVLPPPPQDALDR